MNGVRNQSSQDGPQHLPANITSLQNELFELFDSSQAVPKARDTSFREQMDGPSIVVRGNGK